MESEKKVKPSKLVSSLALSLMMVFCFLFPMFFNPFGLGSVFDFPKWTLLFAVTLLMMILAGVYMFLEKKVIVVDKKALLFAGGFSVMAIVSSIMGTGDFRSFLYGRLGLFISLGILFLTSTILIKDKASKLLGALIGSAVVLSFFELFAFFELLSKMFRNPVFASKAFTPAGSQFLLAVFLAICLIMSLLRALYAKDMGKKILMFVISGVQIIALIFAVSQLLPGQAQNIKFLKFNYGWEIAIEQLKQAKTGLVGVGTDNFAIAFRKSRNVALNNGDDWNVTYNASSNEWLTILTTIGVIGTVMLVLMNLVLIRLGLSLKEEKKTIFWVFLVLLAVMTLMPGNIMLYFLLFILAIVIVTESKEENDLELEMQLDNPAVSVLFYVPILALFIVIPVILLSPLKWLGGVSVTNFVIAENNYSKSLQYYTENRGVEAYNAQIKALELNPTNVNYRLTYSNTCFALANALASNENLTDEEKKNISQLIQQSVREAKTAIALNPENSNLWTNLAQLYRSLLSFAEGADQWALSSYVQAIRLDNMNPQLRLDLGGFLFSLKAYEDAIDQFKQAISLKADFANAYYNLSYAYKANNQMVQAYNAMQNAVTSVDVNSADYERVLTELKELQKLLPEEEKTATGAANIERKSELTKPSPAPTPASSKVEVNEEDLSPEIEEESGFEDVVKDNIEEASVSGDKTTVEE